MRVLRHGRLRTSRRHCVRSRRRRVRSRRHSVRSRRHCVRSRRSRARIGRCVSARRGTGVVRRKIDDPALRRLLGRQVDRLLDIGHQFLLHRLGGLGCTTLGHSVIDLVVLVRHHGATRILRLDLDRRIVSLDDHGRFAAALAAEGEGKSTETAGNHRGADERGDHEAAAARLCGFALGKARHGHRLIEFGIVVELVDCKVVSLRKRPAAGQIVGIELARGRGIGRGRRSGGRLRAQLATIIAGFVGIVVIAWALRRSRRDLGRSSR